MALDPGPRKLFCFGLGYTARALTAYLRERHWNAAGTTRELDKARLFSTRGILMFPFDGTEPVPEGALDGTTHLLSSVPPDGGGDPVLRRHREEIAALLRDRPALRWAGYLSTTGVYGDRGGGWVDEGSALRPTSERARRRVEAEHAWLRLHDEAGVPVHVFRLAGIYGPGRSAIDQLRAGRVRRIVRPGHLFSRIHVDDIVNVLLASMARPNPGAVYNVCDDTPAAPADVTAFAAELLGIEPPPETPFEEAELSDMAASFWADNKRVRNDRIKRELGVTLRYPDYRAGLRACLEAGD